MNAPDATTFGSIDYSIEKQTVWQFAWGDYFFVVLALLALFGLVAGLRFSKRTSLQALMTLSASGLVIFTTALAIYSYERLGAMSANFGNRFPVLMERLQSELVAGGLSFFGLFSLAPFATGMVASAIIRRVRTNAPNP